MEIFYALGFMAALAVALIGLWVVLCILSYAVVLFGQFCVAVVEYVEMRWRDRGC